MPRKAPDKVIEHRISLSNFERKYLDEAMTTHQARIASNTLTNLIGSISVGTLGIAALIWVGFSLDEAIEKVKGWTKKTGYAFADWLTDNGFINYTADEIGRAITETENEKARVYGESLEFYQAAEGNYSSQRGKNYRSELQALEDREVVLRRMLNKIATGDTDGLIEVGWVYQQTESDREATADVLQEWYRAEGGEGEIDWDIDENQ